MPFAVNVVVLDLEKEAVHADDVLVVLVEFVVVVDGWGDLDGQLVAVSYSLYLLLMRSFCWR